MPVLNGRTLEVIVRHDYTDSVWDVWLKYWNSMEGDWYPKGHARVKADGKYEAALDGIVEITGDSERTVKKLLEGVM